MYKREVMALSKIYLHSGEKRRDKIAIPFILSLILHGLLFVLFIIYAFQTRQTLFTRMQKSKELPAELKARAGTLDDNVFFDLQKPSVSQDEAREKVIKQAASLPKQKQPEEIKPTQDAKETNQEKINTHNAGDIAIATGTKISPEAPGEKPLSPEEIKKLALQNILKAPPKEATAQPTEMPHAPKTIGEMIAASSQKPRHHSIATKIPMGVPGILQDEGFDLASRRGDSSKKPTFEDVKYVCYLRKIAKCLADELQTVARTFDAPNNGRVEILFEIGRAGNLTGVELANSSQRYLAALLLELVKMAAPFPPLPKHFDKDSFFSKIVIDYQKTEMYRSMSGAIYALI